MEPLERPLACPGQLAVEGVVEKPLERPEKEAAEGLGGRLLERPVEHDPFRSHWN